MLIPFSVRHQVRERLQMILSTMELDRRQEMIEHVTELVNIVNRYIATAEDDNPRPTRNNG